MSEFELRKAGPTDSEFAYRVKKASSREYVEKVWGWDEGQQLELHQQRFGTQDFRVISVAGEDVGIMAVVLASDCVKVNQLFLLPKHQGRGIGRKCMLRIIGVARRLSLPVRLRVLRVNSRAFAFYRRLGFRSIGQSNTHVFMDRSP